MLKLTPTRNAGEPNITRILNMLEVELCFLENNKKLDKILNLINKYITYNKTSILCKLLSFSSLDVKILSQIQLYKIIYDQNNNSDHYLPIFELKKLANSLQTICNNIAKYSNIKICLYANNKIFPIAIMKNKNITVKIYYENKYLTFTLGENNITPLILSELSLLSSNLGLFTYENIEPDINKHKKRHHQIIKSNFYSNSTFNNLFTISKRYFYTYNNFLKLGNIVTYNADLNLINKLKNNNQKGNNKPYKIIAKNFIDKIAFKKNDKMKNLVHIAMLNNFYSDKKKYQLENISDKYTHIKEPLLLPRVYSRLEQDTLNKLNESISYQTEIAPMQNDGLKVDKEVSGYDKNDIETKLECQKGGLKTPYSEEDLKSQQLTRVGKLDDEKSLHNKKSKLFLIEKTNSYSKNKKTIDLNLKKEIEKKIDDIIKLCNKNILEGLNLLKEDRVSEDGVNYEDLLKKYHTTIDAYNKATTKNKDNVTVYKKSLKNLYKTFETKWDECVASIGIDLVNTPKKILSDVNLLPAKIDKWILNLNSDFDNDSDFNNIINDIKKISEDNFKSVIDILDKTQKLDSHLDSCENSRISLLEQFELEFNTCKKDIISLYEEDKPDSVFSYLEEIYTQIKVGLSNLNSDFDNDSYFDNDSNLEQIINSMHDISKERSKSVIDTLNKLNESISYQTEIAPMQNDGLKVDKEVSGYDKNDIETKLECQKGGLKTPYSEEDLKSQQLTRVDKLDDEESLHNKKSKLFLIEKTNSYSKNKKTIDLNLKKEIEKKIDDIIKLCNKNILEGLNLLKEDRVSEDGVNYEDLLKKYHTTIDAYNKATTKNKDNVTVYKKSLENLYKTFEIKWDECVASIGVDLVDTPKKILSDVNLLSAKIDKWILNLNSDFDNDSDFNNIINDIINDIKKISEDNFKSVIDILDSHLDSCENSRISLCKQLELEFNTCKKKIISLYEEDKPDSVFSYLEEIYTQIKVGLSNLNSDFDNDSYFDNDSNLEQIINSMHDISKERFKSVINILNEIRKKSKNILEKENSNLAIAKKIAKTNQLINNLKVKYADLLDEINLISSDNYKEYFINNETIEINKYLLSILKNVDKFDDNVINKLKSISKKDVESTLRGQILDLIKDLAKFNSMEMYSGKVKNKKNIIELDYTWKNYVSEVMISNSEGSQLVYKDHIYQTKILEVLEKYDGDDETITNQLFVPTQEHILRKYLFENAQNCILAFYNKLLNNADKKTLNKDICSLGKLFNDKKLEGFFGFIEIAKASNIYDIDTLKSFLFMIAEEFLNKELECTYFNFEKACEKIKRLESKINYNYNPDDYILNYDPVQKKVIKKNYKYFKGCNDKLTHVNKESEIQKSSYDGKKLYDKVNIINSDRSPMKYFNNNKNKDTDTVYQKPLYQKNNENRKPKHSYFPSVSPQKKSNQQKSSLEAHREISKSGTKVLSQTCINRPTSRVRL